MSGDTVGRLCTTARRWVPVLCGARRVVSLVRPCNTGTSAGTSPATVGSAAYLVQKLSDASFQTPQLAGNAGYTGGGVATLVGR